MAVQGCPVVVVDTLVLEGILGGHNPVVVDSPPVGIQLAGILPVDIQKGDILAVDKRDILVAADSRALVARQAFEVHVEGGCW